jgi:hypothetical protein
MARIMKAASITESVQAHRRKLAVAESGEYNKVRKGRKSKLADSVIPAAASPGRRTGRPAKALDRPDPVAKNAKPVKTPRRSKPTAAAPATAQSAALSARAAAPHKSAARAQPAAQWDHATDTVRFDWPASEQMASRDGPHQGTAKLLIAARAQGVNSRWPLRRAALSGLRRGSTRQQSRAVHQGGI